MHLVNGTVFDRDRRATRITFVRPLTRALGLASMVAVAAVAAAADDTSRFRFEATGSWFAADPAPASSQSVGVVFSSSEDRWDVASSSLTLAEARASFDVGAMILLAGIERSPDLEMSSSLDYFVPSTSRFTQEDTNAHETLRCYDLALGHRVNPRSWLELTPWLGVTHIRTDSHRLTLISSSRAGISSIVTDAQSVDERLLGVTAGVEARATLRPHLELAGRLAARLAFGTAESDRTWFDLDSGSVMPSTSFTREDSWQSVLGVEAGVTWIVTSWTGLEAGWRYRNWSYGGGPADLNGPYLRVRLQL